MSLAVIPKQLEQLFRDYNVPLEYDDGDYREDYEWCYYITDDLTIQVDATYRTDEPNEYEANVFISPDDGITKTFKEGEEMELIKFITTDKLKLAQDREMERINKDFK